MHVITTGDVFVTGAALVYYLKQSLLEHSTNRKKAPRSAPAPAPAPTAASAVAAAYLLGGRAADQDKFGVFKTLIEFRIGQATAKIAEMEKEIEETKKKKEALEALDLENLSVPVMQVFLDGRKAHEIALPAPRGEEEEEARSSRS